jgi:hypothetical protein
LSPFPPFSPPPRRRLGASTEKSPRLLSVLPTAVGYDELGMKIMTRDDELWITATEAACHFWDPANDGKVATRDQAKAIGFMIAFIVRWQVPGNGCDAFCEDVLTAARDTFARFAEEDAATEAASARLAVASDVPI